MTRRHRSVLATRLALVASFLVAGGLLAGCGDATPRPAHYTFAPGDSPVKVDTPALRALKRTADIATCPSGTGGATTVDGGLPDITLPCLGGGPEVDLAGLRGPLLLNLWAQTCGPCRDESPLLQEFSQRAGQSVRVMGMDFYDPRPGFALAFAKQLRLTYPQIADPQAVTKAPLHVSGLPVTFFVDKAGRVTYTQVGPIDSMSELDDLVREHLGVAEPSAS